MDAEAALEKDLKEFRNAVGKLGNAVNKSGLEWKDDQFKSLSANVGKIARMSKQVLVSGKEYEDALRRLRRIESEK